MKNRIEGGRGAAPVLLSEQSRHLIVPAVIYDFGQPHS